MSKIIFDGNTEPSENTSEETRRETAVKPNLFLGRTEAETKKSGFPDWDIVPPNQFINPRIKKQ